MKGRYEWLVQAVGFALAVAALVLGWQKVQALRSQVFTLQHEQSALPETHLKEVGLAAELKKRAFDIERIQSLIVSREELGRVVSALEEQAKAKGIELTVPDVAERSVVDEKGDLVAAEGPLLDVEIKAVGFGSPENLLRWLHAAEYLPFLLHAESAQLDADSKTIPKSAEGKIESLKSSRLDVTFVVVVKNSPEE